MLKKRRDYEVGRGKPPKESRYKKGQSGNLSGRPKRVPIIDPGTVVEAVDNEDIVVVENGRRKRMAKAEVEFRQLFTSALKGDLKTARLIVSMASIYFAPGVRTQGEYEFMGHSEAIKRFGRKWWKRVKELNMSRGYVQ